MPEPIPPMRWGRLLTAMVTPFDADLMVDVRRARELASRLLDEGSDGLVVSGTTGEAPTLTAQEKLALFREVKAAVGPAVPVVANVGNYCTAESVAFTREASATGVDGVMAVVPYYNNPPQEGLYRHFRAIAEATSLPVVLYNVPSRSPRNLEPATVARLAQDVPNIRILKEAKNDMEQVAATRRSTPDDFIIYSGDDATTLPAMAHGAIGTISVASHVVGREMKRMMELFLGERTDDARRLESELMPVFRGLFTTSNPILVKAALQLLGFDCGGVRLPLVDATPAERDALALVMKHGVPAPAPA